MGIIQRLMKVLLNDAKKEPSVGKHSPPLNPSVFTTIKESQNNKIDALKNNRDVVEGMMFCATLQIRTPLRVLMRHGELHADIKSEPPQIEKEMWEGIWVLKTISDFMPFTVASDIGPILADEYLPFLIAVRKIIESPDSIDDRIKSLGTMPIEGDWATYVTKQGSSHSKHRGMDWIINYFFPRFIDTIPKINNEIIEELSKLGLDTPNRISAAPDELLLSIKGIGQAKLNAIRNYCAGLTDNRDASRVENVTR